VNKWAIAFVVIGLLPCSTLRADDGAASIAAGGIVMKRETRIKMANEVLTISVSKVTVDYDFRNDTDTDITTDIAFPIPPYELDFVKYSINEQGFEDFKLLVDGKPVHFDTESKARLGNRDVTPILRHYGIDVATFGHFDEVHNQSRDIRKLSPSQRKALIAAGLLDNDPDTDWVSWKVEKKYYWKQTFPAHATTHISHTYSPVVGFGLVPQSSFNAAKQTARAADIKDPGVDRESVEEVKSVCPTDALLASLEKARSRDSQSQGYGYLEYVDFILTTANTWKQPIADFTLFIERPHDNHREDYVVSLCWPGRVEQVQPNLFKATATDLIPTHELRIGFFGFNK
jgi:hypothetical protein